MKANDFVAVKATDDQMQLINMYSEQYQDLAADIIASVNASPHRTAALRLLLESKMTLIHGITHDE